MNKHISVEEKGSVLILRINRPEKKNALTVAMYAEMAGAIQRLDQESKLRILVILGHEAAFSAGNDISDFLNNPPQDASSPVIRFLTLLSQTSKPVIAGVQGHAVGIGTTMLLHCDLVYAAENAMFQLPFVNLGLVPEAASSLLLPRLIGPQRAAELFYFGEPFSVEVAHQIGLVNEITPSEEVVETALTRAAKLSALPPGAVRATKQLLRLDQDNVAARMQEEMRLFVDRLKSPEAQEAFMAFMDKRPADFSRFD